MSSSKRFHIVLISNVFSNLYEFRKELMEALLDKYRVTVVALMETGDRENYEKLKEKGCELVEANIERRGKNPFQELSLYNTYKKILVNAHADLVITYTIKPNIYAGLVCKKLKIPYFSNITGLGSAIMSGGILAKLVLSLYKPAIRNASRVFFQNSHSRKIFVDNGLIKDDKKVIMVPGSGVNLEKNSYEEFKEENANTFLYLARIMKDKGADEFFYAAEKMKEKHPDVKFQILGACEESYDGMLEDFEKRNIITFYGWRNDVHEFMKNAGCIVNPSYHEGLSNVCLEGASTGRCLITSDIPGCREINEDGVTGFLCEVKNKESLLECMEKYYSLSFDEKRKMGHNARDKVSREFDRKTVTGIYLKEIEKLLLSVGE